MSGLGGYVHRYNILWKLCKLKVGGREERKQEKRRKYGVWGWGVVGSLEEKKIKWRFTTAKDIEGEREKRISEPQTHTHTSQSELSKQEMTRKNLPLFQKLIIRN